MIDRLLHGVTAIYRVNLSGDPGRVKVRRSIDRDRGKSHHLKLAVKCHDWHMISLAIIVSSVQRRKSLLGQLTILRIFTLMNSTGQLTSLKLLLRWGSFCFK